MWTEASEDVRRYIVDHILDERDADQPTFDSPLLEWGVIDSLTIEAFTELMARFRETAR